MHSIVGGCHRECRRQEMRGTENPRMVDKVLNVHHRSTLFLRKYSVKKDKVPMDVNSLQG